MERRPIAILTELRASAAHGEVSHGGVAGIEVTMKHEVAGRIDGPGTDLETLAWFVFAPHHGKACTLSYRNHGARPVAVKSAAASYGDLLYVAAVDGPRQTKAHDADPFALHGVIIQSEGVYVRDKVRLPTAECKRHVMLKKIRLVAKAVMELEGIAKDKIFVMKQVDQVR